MSKTLLHEESELFLTITSQIPSSDFKILNHLSKKKPLAKIEMKIIKF